VKESRQTPPNKLAEAIAARMLVADGITPELRE
jgi:hypothetical protein